jgi:PAS domain S-box-containing protein
LTAGAPADKLGPGDKGYHPAMTRETDDSVLLETLLNAAVDAIIVADADGRMIRVNPAAATMFGYGPDDMTGRSIDMLVPDTERVDHGQRIADYLATGLARIIGIGRDVEAVRKDGSIFPAHLTVGRGTIGDQPVFVGSLHDLTARQQAQQAVEAAQRMEALARLTGGIAHDFNNLLTIIIGNLELLEAKLADDRQKSLLNEALSAAEIGTKVIEKLLVHGRRGPLQPIRLDVNAVIGEVTGLLSRTLSPRIKIRTALGAGIWPIDADPEQLQNALINLVVNARDAMPDGGEIVISSSNVETDEFIAAETGATPGRYARVSITDNGQGMTSDVKQRAFEPFFTTKAAGKGTGLGLATVYGFVRQSGGHVTLYSEVGLGTTISLHFPAATGSPVAPDDDRPETVWAQDTGQTILVVEDDEAILRLSVSRIEALGYRALPAADSNEAMDILASNPEIDALFTDIVMPGGMNGLDLARKVRADRPGIAILLTSGFSGDLIHPGNGFSTNFQLLSKPYRQEELATRLRILLSGRVS